jgi:hypothetical protein
MKLVLFIVITFVTLLAAGGGYIVWSNHESDQTMRKSYTPFTDNGPSIPNPFSDVKTEPGESNHE